MSSWTCDEAKSKEMPRSFFFDQKQQQQHLEYFSWTPYASIYSTSPLPMLMMLLAKKAEKKRERRVETRWHRPSFPPILAILFLPSQKHLLLAPTHLDHLDSWQQSQMPKSIFAYDGGREAQQCLFSGPHMHQRVHSCAQTPRATMHALLFLVPWPEPDFFRIHLHVPLGVAKQD